MNNYAKPGQILYNYARNACYLVLERTINVAGAWKCIYRGDDGRYRLYYISDAELRLTQDGIWKTLSGITVNDAVLNSIIRGDGSSFETLKKVFDLADTVVMKMKYSNEKKKENA